MTGIHGGNNSTSVCCGPEGLLGSLTAIPILIYFHLRIYQRELDKAPDTLGYPIAYPTSMSYPQLPRLATSNQDSQNLN